MDERDEWVVDERAGGLERRTPLLADRRLLASPGEERRALRFAEAAADRDPREFVPRRDAFLLRWPADVLLCELLRIDRAVRLGLPRDTRARCVWPREELREWLRDTLRDRPRDALCEWLRDDALCEWLRAEELRPCRLLRSFRLGPAKASAQATRRTAAIRHGKARRSPEFVIISPLLVLFAIAHTTLSTEQ